MLKVYIAAPLFSAAEQTFNRFLKQRLSPYFSVYLPQEDGELLVEVVARGEEAGMADRLPVPLPVLSQSGYVDPHQRHTRTDRAGGRSTEQVQAWA